MEARKLAAVADRPFGREVVPLPGASVGCNSGMPVSVAVRAYIRTPRRTTKRVGD